MTWLEPPASWSVLPLHSHPIHLHACVLFRLWHFGSLLMMRSKGCRQQLKGALAAKRGHQKREMFARPASLLAPWRPAETAAPSSDANWSKKPPDLSEDKREIIFFNSCQRGHGSFLSTILYYILLQPLLCKALFFSLVSDDWTSKYVTPKRWTCSSSVFQWRARKICFSLPAFFV